MVSVSKIRPSVTMTYISDLLVVQKLHWQICTESSPPREDSRCLRHWIPPVRSVSGKHIADIIGTIYTYIYIIMFLFIYLSIYLSISLFMYWFMFILIYVKKRIRMRKQKNKQIITVADKSINHRINETTWINWINWIILNRVIKNKTAICWKTNHCHTYI